MCTVSYIPLKNGFVLTSNRDEMSGRPASLHPDFYRHDHISLYFPKDPQGLGTWIAVAEDERAACLLNGGFETHKHLPPYNRSRGLIVLESFDYDSPFEFYTHVNLEGVEPFTLVMVWANCVYELKWTGHRKHFTALANVPHLWASATLYDQAVVQKKRQWLNEFLEKTPVISQEEVLHFHKHGGASDHINGMTIDRPGSVKTLSITSIQISNAEVNILQDQFDSVFEDRWDSHFKEENAW
jgi:uncharacterized protein with NRDE domain